MLSLNFATLLAPFSLLANVQAKTSPLPVVDLGYAVHRATINDTGKYPYYKFSNIRYAAPPVGNLRFSAPVAPNTINRTINDGQKAVTCFQATPEWSFTAQEFLSGVPLANLSFAQPTFTLGMVPPMDPSASEDCLFLDVMVPQSIYHGSQAAPVLVWIYGGGFTTGNKASLNPATLLERARDNAQKGMIFVALNYRLGLFGWQSGPTFQEDGTANAGLYDQRFALEWVRANIAKFGGDSNRVTVMGESAGGASIEHQITAFGGLAGKAPFAQAIVQSPGFSPIPTPSQQETTFLEVLKYATLIAGRNITSVADLRSLTSQELYETNYAVVGTAPWGSFVFGPAVDGLFVPALPGQLILHGQYDKDLKVMTGHNSAEGIVFAPPFVTDEASATAFAKTVFPNVPDVITYIETVLYPQVFDGTYGYSNYYELIALVSGDASISCNARYLSQAFKDRAYAYSFSIPPGFHGQDVAYTFYNGDRSLDDGLAVIVSVATVLQDYITSFVTTGTPNELGVSYFPVYGANSSTQNLGITNFGGQVTDTAAGARCAWWQKGLYY